MIKRVALCAMAASLSLAEAVAAPAPCEAHYTQEGSFLAGRRFTTWDTVADVAPADAFNRIYREGVKSGLTVASSDRELGVISFKQANAGVTNNGQQVDLPWNVSIEAEQGGSRISVSKATPGGYATSKDFQIRSMCAVIDAARS